jgi:hypothetical protein
MTLWENIIEIVDEEAIDDVILLASSFWEALPFMVGLIGLSYRVNGSFEITDRCL